MATLKMPKPNEALRDFFADNEVYADLFNSLIFGGEKVIKAEDLRPMDTAYAESVMLVDGQKKILRTRDLARKTSLGVNLVILGIEDQDKVHYAQPVRNLLYDALGYAAEIKELAKTEDKTGWTADAYLSKIPKGSKITPIITIVFYTGENAWDGPRSLHDMMDIDERIKAYIPEYPINLIDVGHDSREMCGEKLSALQECLKYYMTGTPTDKKVDSSIMSLAAVLVGDKSMYEQASIMEGGKMPMWNAVKERDEMLTRKVREERDAAKAENIALVSKVSAKDEEILALKSEIARLKAERVNNN